MESDPIPQQQSLRLDGLRVLVVEDEYYIADDLRRHLKDAGAYVVGPCPTMKTAQAALNSEQVDCAVIDLNLNGESAAPIAERLSELRIPFAIATGYGSESVPERYSSTPRCEKPFDPAALVALLAQLTKAEA